MVSGISAYIKTLDVRYDDLRAALEQYALPCPRSIWAKTIFSPKSRICWPRAAHLLNTTISLTTSVFSALFNFLMGIVFSVYILAQKETLARQLKKLLYVSFPADKVTAFLAFLSRVCRTFPQFVTGQIIEAFILGTLVLLGMLIFRLPYASVIAVLVGCTALIPVLGAWIGAIVGALLILPVSLMKAIWFVVFLVVLQQIEGNLI